MAHYPGVCPKHQSNRCPITDCEDCKEEQRRNLRKAAKVANPGT